MVLLRIYFSYVNMIHEETKVIVPVKHTVGVIIDVRYINVRSILVISHAVRFSVNY